MDAISDLLQGFTNMQLAPAAAGPAVLSFDLAELAKD
jgi:hypothetical protein